MNGQVSGPAPMDGQSLQRQATGNCAGIGAPTPNAPNATLTCQTQSGPDAGVDPGGEDEADGCCSGAGSDGWLGVVVVAGLGVMRPTRRRRGDVLR